MVKMGSLSLRMNIIIYGEILLMTHTPQNTRKIKQKTDSISSPLMFTTLNLLSLFFRIVVRFVHFCSGGGGGFRFLPVTDGRRQRSDSEPQRRHRVRLCHFHQKRRRCEWRAHLTRHGRATGGQDTQRRCLQQRREHFRDTVGH